MAIIVVSGQASAFPAEAKSQRWKVFGPHADIRVTLALHDTVTCGQILVSGHLPGTDISQYQTINECKTIVGSGLPQAGGPLPGDSSVASELTLAGLAMLALSGACFATNFLLRDERPD